jgi:putative toxin-antitoxin system antitoxin component (TIGR02293 family)
MHAETIAPVQRARPTRNRPPAQHIDPATIDARVVALLEDAALRSQVQKLDKVELAGVWRLTERALSRKAGAEPAPVAAIDTHRRLLEGLPGEALLVSSAMFLPNLAEAEKFFGMSFKTLKARLGGRLDAAAGERALRAARAVMTAATVLGSWDAARSYMHTRNFALGGATPAELLKTADGERIVLNELHAQAEGAPL